MESKYALKEIIDNYLLKGIQISRETLLQNLHNEILIIKLKNDYFFLLWEEEENITLDFTIPKLIVLNFYIGNKIIKTIPVKTSSEFVHYEDEFYAYLTNGIQHCPKVHSYRRGYLFSKK